MQCFFHFQSEKMLSYGVLVALENVRQHAYAINTAILQLLNAYFQMKKWGYFVLLLPRLSRGYLLQMRW